MKVKITDLKDALTAVKMGISPNENIDQSNHFIFQDGYIYAFNNEIIVIKKSPLNIEGAIIAKEFMEVLDKLDIPEIRIKEKGNMFILSSIEKERQTTVGVAFSKDITLPLVEVGNIFDIKWKKVPDNFVEGLYVTSPNVSRDSSTGILQCVYVNKDTVEATDNYNIVRFEMPNGKMSPFSIYGPSASKIAKHDITKYAVTDNWVFFKTKNGTIIGSRNFNEAGYPNNTKFFSDFSGKEQKLPIELKKSISTAQIFVDANSEDLIDLSLKKNWVIIKAVGPTGFVEEKIKVKGKVKDFSIEISLPQLHFLLSHSAIIAFSDRLARIKSDNCTYICSLR